MDSLRDIKPLVEIPDLSFYTYIISIVIFSIAFFIFVYKIVKIFSKKREDRRKKLFRELKSVDFTNSKEAAYKITKYGRELVYDDRSYKIFEELLKKVQKYKYKKEVPLVDEETKKYFKLFLETING